MAQKAPSALRKIHLSEARAIVESKMFGEDWIPELTSAEVELIEKYGPKTKMVGAKSVDVIERCPSKDIAARLDRALGRRCRWAWQKNAADVWLRTSGPTCTFSMYDRAAFEKALLTIDRASESYRPARGRVETAAILAEAKLRQEVANGRATALKSMTDKELAAELECSRKVAKKVRERAAI